MKKLIVIVVIVLIVVAAYKNRVKIITLLQRLKLMKNNRDLILKEASKAGITNKYFQAAMVGVAFKESKLVPIDEVSFKNTSNSRIRAVYPTRLGSLSDAQLNEIKKDDVKFFDAVYGGQYGNDQPGDGYKYKGRGFIQVTFKNNYKRLSKYAGVDLVKHPEKLNDPIIAAKVAVGYYIEETSPARLAEYGLKSINDIADIQTAVRIAMRQVSGWGKRIDGTVFTEGELKAMSYAQQLISLL